MFHCFHARKLRSFLLLDIAAVLLWLFCSAVGRAFSAEARPEGIFLPVIMYHSITEHPSGDYQITPDAFAEDLRYLRANGYESVSVAQLLAYTEGTGTLPAHPVLLTFDDGFYNNLSAALPLLEQYDMCAVVSVVGYYTDVTAARDPHVPAYSYLEWEDIRALLRSGRIEIGSHTYDLHSNEERAGCSILFGEEEEAYTEMLRQDVGLLQSRMQEETGYTPVVFAYPYGFICRESIPVLRELGFVCTLTCYEKPNYITRDSSCLYGLYRYNRSPDDTAEEFFSRVLAGA